MKELKRRVKVVEIFCGPEAVEKLVYLVLVQENEKLLKRRLRGFAEIQMGSCHAAETHFLSNCVKGQAGAGLYRHGLPP